MTLARRLLMVGGGSGSFTAPPPSLVTLTDAPAGGWTQIPEARVLSHAGYLYLTYVNGSTGDVCVRYATGDGLTVGPEIVLHSALSSPADTHDCPGLLVMDDGKLLACYSAHNGATMYRRVSTNTVDSDPTLSGGFASEGTVKGSGTYTYPFVMQRMSESGSPVYVWYRSGSTTLTYSKSTDHGATWSHGPTVWADGAAYWKISTDSLWRIDFVCTEGNPSEASSRIFHFYADDVDYHASDGTIIGDPPHSSASGVTEVYDSSDGPGWATDIYTDDNNPVIVFNVDQDPTGAFRYARWNGSAWDVSDIEPDVGFPIDDPSPVAALDPATPSRLHAVKVVGGMHELWEYTTADGGATWTGTMVASDVGGYNIYPANIVGHAAGGFAVAWLFGDYTGAETAFDLGIKARR